SSYPAPPAARAALRPPSAKESACAPLRGPPSRPAAWSLATAPVRAALPLATRGSALCPPPPRFGPRGDRSRPVPAPWPRARRTRPALPTRSRARGTAGAYSGWAPLGVAWRHGRRAGGRLEAGGGPRPACGIRPAHALSRLIRAGDARLVERPRRAFAQGVREERRHGVERRRALGDRLIQIPVDVRHGELHARGRSGGGVLQHLRA